MSVYGCVILKACDGKAVDAALLETRACSRVYVTEPSVMDDT